MENVQVKLELRRQHANRKYFLQILIRLQHAQDCYWFFELLRRAREQTDTQQQCIQEFDRMLRRYPLPPLD